MSDNIYTSPTTYTTDDDSGWLRYPNIPCMTIYARVYFVDTTWTEDTTDPWTTTHDPFGATDQVTLTWNCAFDADGGGAFIRSTYIVDQVVNNPFTSLYAFSGGSAGAPLPDYFKLSWVVDSGTAEFRVAWYGAQI